MPRELMEAAAAPAMAPTASVASFSLKFLLRLVRTHGLEVKVIGAWVVWFIVRQLQSVFGPWRRCSRNGSVQYTAMAVYYLPTLIAFYAAKEVYSSPDSATKVGLSLGCAFILFLCARGTVTMTVFTLDKGPDRVQNWRLLPWLLYFGWLAIWLDGKLTASDAYGFLVFIGPVLYVLLAKPRAAVLDYETKQFADYMAQHEVLFDGDADNLYKGCRYPFMKLGDNQWKIFSDVQDELPTDDCAVDPADNCLSYIFCRLLARRYFGFPCAEDGNAQVRDFVLTELLADWDKAFTIVQVQLALLHDYFFTNFLSDIDSGLLSCKQVVGELFLTLLPIAIAVIIYGLYSEVHSGEVVRLLVEGVIEGILAFMIGQPRTPCLPRYWHPIRTLFLYFRKEGTVDKRPAAPSQSSYYWRDKMGQYSVMEDYDRGLSLKDVLAWFKRRLLSQASYSFIKHHPAENKDVSVSDSIKRFLAHTIKDLNGPPTIGARSLDDFSWSCRQGTLTDTILIWHIATCYCDMSQQPLDEETVPQSLQQNMSQPLEEPSTGYRKVATTLSRYCAYLVAFHPELLPEHSLTVKVVLQQVLQEAKDGLGTTRMTMEEKRVEIQQHQLPEEESSMETLEKGVRLGRQLEQQQDVSLRWKAMADFWAEMILYVAWSSDNAAAHIELLAQGGEFLTHIWALLCNAGMVREQKSTSE